MFLDFSAQKLRVCIACKNYIFNYFLASCLIIYKQTKKLVISIAQTNVLYTVTEKYPLKCVFVYNIISPNESLFLLVSFLCEQVHDFALNAV